MIFFKKIIILLLLYISTDHITGQKFFSRPQVQKYLGTLNNSPAVSFNFGISHVIVLDICGCMLISFMNSVICLVAADMHLNPSGCENSY